MKKIILASIITIFAIQIYVPLSIIIEKEDILKSGETLKFEIQPIDPYDPFRGKYLIVKVKNKIYLDDKKFDYSKFSRDQKVYAIIKKEKDGFCKFDSISLEKPKTKLFIKTTIARIYNYSKRDSQKIYGFSNSKSSIVIKVPFDRYYINEKYAKAGEELYNKFSNKKKEDAYIIVKLKNGKAVLENLYFKNVKVNKYIKAELNKLK